MSGMAAAVPMSTRANIGTLDTARRPLIPLPFRRGA